MKIALITEGNYPFATGGVSTWCDQLLRGMPEHEWVVVGLTPTGREPLVWPMPPSVSSVVLHPVWGAEATPARRGRRGADAGPLIEAALLSLWNAALAPDSESVLDEAESALRELVLLSNRRRMASLLAAHGSTSALMTAWSTHCSDLPRLSVAEAVAASRLVDRMLAVVDAPVPPVDVVHAAGNGAAAMVGLAVHWRNKTPLVLSEHGVYLRERYVALDQGGLSWVERRAVTSLMRRLCQVAYRVAERILPVSDFNRRWALQLGADPARVQTIHNGVNPSLYRQVGAEPEVPTLSFVGRIDPLKDLHTLVRAFALVREKVPSARLRLFGPVSKANESYRDSVAQLVSELSLAGAVTFEGPSNGSRPAIEAGSIVVLSSISEGLPFSLIEAMMCGRATVSTDVGGVAECLDPEGRSGVVVPARDPVEFADACVRLLMDDELRHTMAAAARQHALATATSERMLTAYRGVYDSVSGRRLTLAAVDLPGDRMAVVSSLVPADALVTTELAS
jgi:glycosyltransferase involved in cell wall biosynthesis